MVNIALSQASSELIKQGIVICGNKPKYLIPLLSTIVLLTRFIRFLLKPLRQPKVVTDILGGIILGPSVLGRNHKFRSYVFPDNGYYVIQNIAILGFMYFLFLSGVKIDINVPKRAEKKHWYIAFAGIITPLCSSLAIAFIERKSLDKETMKISSIWGISSYLAITSFPVLYPIVSELNLLSSGIGRTALSTAVVGDIIGMNALVVFEASKQGENRAITALWFMISSIFVVLTLISGVRQAMVWIVRSTPEGKPVDQIYVVSVLLGVMVTGFVSDMFGLTIVNGPLWLGLAVPDGPPLGTILVEKSEVIVKKFFMPFSFMYVGSIIDVPSTSGLWDQLHPLLLIVLVSHVMKIVSTLIASRFFDLGVRDSLTHSLIMSLKGEVEILLFLHLLDYKVIGKPQFTVMVLSAVSVTALATPLISILYDPTRPYMVNKRRNIQHNAPNTALRIVACLHTKENLGGVLKLLEISNPTVNSPLSVHALRLVELVGRSNPTLIDHEKDKKEPDSGPIHNALRNFQVSREGSVRIHSYTTITSKKSMYQDICELALSKKACLVVLPYDGSTPVNASVLANAPCSVAILVDKSPQQSLVDKGPARHYADRMAENREVYLDVVRFLAEEGNEGDEEVEKRLDDGLVTWFWVKSEANRRIGYREVVVKNGEDTIAAIQGMKSKESYSVWIVGRKHGVNPVVVKGLSSWSENDELGVIGDYLASVDFESNGWVLVVQQQVLLGQEKGSNGVLSSSFPFCV
ncbi:Cation/H(+) antiporter 25 [Striga asiatica]|uniref:Cation/H(+) antiporter 25 n=1 Tax=Striga asiatica TaxID=4170 RepID=A0A5A7PT50_STRAF|nr:Cation/H(+) antiporter 25 [Striga asiatica]